MHATPQRREHRTPGSGKHAGSIPLDSLRSYLLRCRYRSTPPSQGDSAMSITCTKLAWIRDPNVPAGQPALGSFSCVCGNTISGVSFGSAETHQCTCGRVWDGHGWAVQA